MKKCLLLACLIASFTGVMAQTEKGNGFVGASSNLNYVTQSFHDSYGRNVSSFNFELSNGIFAADNFLMGYTVSYERQKGYLASSTFGIGPAFRYYLNNAFLGVGNTFIKSKVELDDEEGISEGGITNFELGYAAFLADNLALEPSLAYGIGTTGDYVNTSILGIRIGFSLYF